MVLLPEPKRKMVETGEFTMRADRLLSLLMLLQSHGKMTARQLADELEVSERTIYRDIDALSLSGVPIYGEAGPDGGYALLDSYRTNLTGLTEHEVRALFMMSVPVPLADLGMGRELQAALRKLSAALPETMRQNERRTRKRFYLDSSWWHRAGEQVPFLQTIHQAVWQDCKINILHRLPIGVEVEQTVDPYGLVAKVGIWYLVCVAMNRTRVIRVAELVEVSLSEETFERSADFDLIAYWHDWCEVYERRQASFTASVRVAPGSLPELIRYFGESAVTRAQIRGSYDTDGWLHLDLLFSSLETARERILPFGRGVEVLQPWALRRSIQDYAEQIVSLYQEQHHELGPTCFTAGVDP